MPNDTNGTIEVRAQWPGRVDEVHVAVGQRVEREDPLLTIESMKMLNEIESPVGGQVVAIHVAVDGVVDEGTLLAEVSPG